MPKLINEVWAISTDPSDGNKGNTDIVFGTKNNLKPAIRKLY